ncbi:MAG: hypothetical protein KF729_34480 [Sandaracinaceae bacterium]|nr:hypothetical protein [Sandaracinaceae bacterium]
MSDANETPRAVRGPFTLEVTRIARLVVCDVAGDPTYAAIEVQVFDDDARGAGFVVLLGRGDGLVDVYRQPGLRLEPDAYRIGRGLGRWLEAPIDPARFEIDPDGVALHVGLTDAEGRAIELAIDDRDGRARRRGDLLAPMGSTIEAPVSLMLVYMRGFDFVRTSGVRPRVTIGGHARALAPFPGPLSFGRLYARYASAPLIVTLNRACDGPLERLVLDEPATLRAGAGADAAVLRLSPGWPDLAAVSPGERRDGEWVLGVADVERFLAGTWTVTGTDDGAALELAVTRGWTPRGLPPLYRFVTAVGKVFREWPTTYRWRASVRRAEPPTLRSRWERTR